MSLIVALTGGIASGKSSTADAFRTHCVPTFDADLLARDLVRPGEPALAAIVERFGSAALLPSGELDRPRMRERVFADPAQRRKLEAILHPRVNERLRALTRSCHEPYCVLAIPLLAETRDEYRWLDRVLVVDVPSDVQISRLVQRDSISRDAAVQMLSAQALREQRLALADDVVDNSGPADALINAVARLDLHYRRIAAERVYK
mgnify:CR=1 FL=1